MHKASLVFVLLCCTLSVYPLIEFESVEHFNTMKDSIPTLVMTVHTKACNACSKFDDALRAIEHNIGDERFRTGKLEYSDEFEEQYEELIYETGMTERRDDVPMLLVFRYGVGSPYAGPAKGEAMMNYFMHEVNDKFLNEINTMEQKHKVMGSLDMTQIVAYIDKKSKLRSTILKFSHKLRGKAKVSLITNSEIAETLSMKLGDVILHRAFEDDITIKLGKETKEDLVLKKLMSLFERNKFKWIEFVTPLSALLLTRRYQNLIMVFVDYVSKTESYRILQEMRFVAERYLREVFADDVDDIAEQTTTVFAYKELKNDPFGLHVKHNGTATESLPKLVIYKKKKEIEIYKDDLTNQEQVIEWIHNTLETTPEIIAKEPIESDHDEL